MRKTIETHSQHRPALSLTLLGLSWLSPRTRTFGGSMQLLTFRLA